MKPELQPNAKVFDRWWPDRLGIVEKRLKTRLHVRWSDGELWRYDVAHAQFLEVWAARRARRCEEQSMTGYERLREAFRAWRAQRPPPQLVIWWTTSEDWRAIAQHHDCLPTWCPAYLQRQFTSRKGRPGRVRLWMDDELGAQPGLAWPEPETAMQTRLNDYAGIVVRAEDVFTLQNLPGLVTDFSLQRWAP